MKQDWLPNYLRRICRRFDNNTGFTDCEAVDTVRDEAIPFESFGSSSWLGRIDLRSTVFYEMGDRLAIDVVSLKRISTHGVRPESLPFPRVR